MSSFLQHTAGDYSHKKLIALSFGLISCVMAVIAFVMALYHPLGDAKTILAIILGFAKWAVIAAGVTGGVEAIKGTKDLFGKKQ